MSKRIKIPEEHRQVCVHHEAGHAVIARVLGFKCGGAVVPVYEMANRQGGQATIYASSETLKSWRRRGKFRDGRSIAHGQIMIMLAGQEAEIVCCGAYIENGNGRDLEIANGWLRLASPPSLERWRAKTRGLVRRHRHKIERVAQALLAKRKLSARAIDRLMKPPEPWEGAPSLRAP